MRFRDRHDAGRALAQALAAWAGRDDVLVLGLPRGGVVVAYEVALALRAPLDVWVVRKLGVPANPELAFGAIARHGVRVLAEDVVAELSIDAETIESVAATERAELERRERLYRGERPFPDLAGRTAILVDDGFATGSTMLAAVASVRTHAPIRIVVAVPVGAPATCVELGSHADEVVCLRRPEPFVAVGVGYDDFGQTSDDEVRDLLTGRTSTPSADPLR